MLKRLLRREVPEKREEEPYDPRLEELEEAEPFKPIHPVEGGKRFQVEHRDDSQKTLLPIPPPKDGPSSMGMNESQIRYEDKGRQALRDLVRKRQQRKQAKEDEKDSSIRRQQKQQQQLEQQDQEQSLQISMRQSGDQIRPHPSLSPVGTTSQTTSIKGPLRDRILLAKAITDPASLFKKKKKPIDATGMSIIFPCLGSAISVPFWGMIRDDHGRKGVSFQDFLFLFI